MNQVENLAHACLLKPCLEGYAAMSAFRWVSSSMDAQEYTYAWLDEQSIQIATLLHELGIHSGDGVSIFLPRSRLPLDRCFAYLRR